MKTKIVIRNNLANLIKLAYYITDWELFKKPNSTAIRESVVKDILSVDPKKWFHPKLPNGETNPYCGTIEKDENGKDVMKGIDFNIYKYEHPDLKYKIDDVPLATCKEGEYKNVTKKDCQIIRDVLYTSQDNSVSYINLKLVNNPWYILYYKSKCYHSLFYFLLALSLLLYFFTKITLLIIGLLGVGWLIKMILDKFSDRGNMSV